MTASAETVIAVPRDMAKTESTPPRRSPFNSENDSTRSEPEHGRKPTAMTADQASRTEKSLPEIIAGSGMHWGVAAAFIAAIMAYILLNRHMLGFQIRLTGEAPRAARFSGVKPGRLVLFCMGTAGALAGLAGMFEVSGPAGQITTGFNVGYGFTAIIVAFLGRLHPIGIVLAGLLMALTYIGGEAAQSTMQLPAAAIQVFQGMLLFFLLAVDVLTNYRIRITLGEAA